MKFKEDTPYIQLNPKDPIYNYWKQLRDISQDPIREPGPINIQRFEGGFIPTGIPTFFRQPVALNPADLIAGNVDVAIMGAYADMGIGMRGTTNGPQALRTSDVYGSWGILTLPHVHTMVDALQELKIVDYGDAPHDPMSIERSLHEIRKMVAEIASTINKSGNHVIPIIVGGDHSLGYSDVAGLVDVYGKGNVGVIHFDAHCDASEGLFGHMKSHSSWVYYLINEGHVKGKDFIQVGLRGYYPDAETFRWMRQEGFRYHTMAEVEQRGWQPVMEDIIKEAHDGPEYLFISLDLDVLEPAYAPGVGTPEPGGLTPREVFPLVRRLCAETNVVGMDIVELNPLIDPTYLTALNANRILREMLNGLTIRKLGITEKHYLSPLTVDDGK